MAGNNPPKRKKNGDGKVLERGEASLRQVPSGSSTSDQSQSECRDTIPDMGSRDDDGSQKIPAHTQTALPAPISTGANPKKFGRPSDYKEEYCEALLSHCNEGLSFESFAGVVGVARNTLYEWAKVHPAFQDAQKRAKQLQLLYGERIGKKFIEGDNKDGNVTAWIFWQKNISNWSDRQVIKEEKDPDSEEKKKTLDSLIDQLEQLRKA